MLKTLLFSVLLTAPTMIFAVGSSLANDEKTFSLPKSTSQKSIKTFANYLTCAEGLNSPEFNFKHGDPNLLSLRALANCSNGSELMTWIFEPGKVHFISRNRSMFQAFKPGIGKGSYCGSDKSKLKKDELEAPFPFTTVKLETSRGTRYVDIDASGDDFGSLYTQTPERYSIHDPKCKTDPKSANCFSSLRLNDVGDGGVDFNYASGHCGPHGILAERSDCSPQVSGTYAPIEDLLLSALDSPFQVLESSLENYIEQCNDPESKPPRVQTKAEIVKNCKRKRTENAVRFCISQSAWNNEHAPIRCTQAGLDGLVKRSKKVATEKLNACRTIPAFTSKVDRLLKNVAGYDFKGTLPPGVKVKAPVQNNSATKVE